MIQSDIIDSELTEGSEGIQEDLHYSKSCDPVIKKGFFMRDNNTYSRVVIYFRNCSCASYDQDTCDRNLKKFRRSSVLLPTDGIYIHRPDCEQTVTKRKGYWKDNMQRTCYKYMYNCFCRYTLKQNTNHHDPNDRGKFLVYIRYTHV